MVVGGEREKGVKMRPGVGGGGGGGGLGRQADRGREQP